MKTPKGLPTRGDWQWEMFVEDVANAAMPIGGKSRTGTPVVRLESSNDRAEAILASALSGSDSARGRDLADSAASFIRGCFEALLRNGDVEFVAVDRTDRAGRPVFRFCNRDIEKRYGEQLSPSRTLNSLRIALPAAYRAEVERARKALLALGLPPSPAERAADGSIEPIPVSIGTFSRQEAIVIAAATPSIGWDGRGPVRQIVSNYFAIRRDILYARFRVTLRDQVLTALNGWLAGNRDALGFEARLVLGGLATSSAVEEAEELLTRGAMSFVEIIKPLIGL